MSLRKSGSLLSLPEPPRKYRSMVRTIMMRPAANTIALTSIRSSREKSRSRTNRAYKPSTQKDSPLQAKAFIGSIHGTSPMPLRTPLYDIHVAAGATMTEFGGWEMPLQYDGIVAEHKAVRTAAGLFDVSHMGKIMVSGRDAGGFLGRLATNNVPRKPFRARYTHLCDEEGRILDDVIITCLASDRYFLVCNAGPRDRVVRWLRRHAVGEDVQDITSDYLCLALQGPKAARILQLAASFDVEALKPFAGSVGELLLSRRLGVSRSSDATAPEAVGWVSGESGEAGLADHSFVTRTGYTGEDGFELFPDNDLGVVLWEALLAAGRDAGLRPVGLGARDTLRLEKGFLLSGTDFDGTQTPLEAASERFVRWDHEFIGRTASRPRTSDPRLRSRARASTSSCATDRYRRRLLISHSCSPFM